LKVSLPFRYDDDDDDDIDDADASSNEDEEFDCCRNDNGEESSA